MAITFNGDTGIEFPDGTVKGSAHSAIAVLGIGSYVFADTKSLPSLSNDIPYGAVARGDELYGSDRAGSRDPNPVSTSDTRWQASGFSTNTDRAMLWRRIE